MKTVKKLVYFYLSFLLLAWLFLPFAAKAITIDRVLCVYLGPGDYRQYIYTCYENWENATGKMNALDNELQSLGILNKPCDPITSEYGAADLLSSSNANKYCNDQNGSSTCAAAEAMGNALLQKICLPPATTSPPAQPPPTATSFGTVDLTQGQATVTQIQPGIEYGFRLAVDEYPSTGFYFNNITQIDVYKTETSTNYSSGSRLITSVGAISSADIDVKSRFENSTMVIVPAGSSSTNVQLSAKISYAATYPNGVSYPDSGQTKTFNTNATTYTVTSQTNTGTGTGTGTGGTGTGTGTGTGVGAGTNIGDFSTYIFGNACTSINIISCYLEKIMRLFIAIASLGSIFMIVFGGILLTTSAGDPKKITRGRLAVMGAIIGLVIVLLSYSILQFVQQKITQGASGSTPITNNGSTTPLPNNNSVSGTLTFTSSGLSVTYNIKSRGTPTSFVEDNGLACGLIAIGGNATSTVSCLDIRAAFKLQGSDPGPYPDANFWGEQDSPAGKTYYLQQIFIDPANGNATVYYKKTWGSSDIFYDTWTAGVGGSGGGVSGQLPNTVTQTGASITFTGPVTSSSIGCDGVDYLLKTQYPMDTYSIQSIEKDLEEFTVFYKIVNGDGKIHYDTWDPSSALALYSAYTKTGAYLTDESMTEAPASSCNLSTQSTTQTPASDTSQNTSSSNPYQLPTSNEPYALPQ